jgi:hypothetical protein
VTKPLTAFFIAAGLVGLTLISLPSARLIDGHALSSAGIETDAPASAATLIRCGTR